MRSSHWHGARARIGRQMALPQLCHFRIFQLKTFFYSICSFLFPFVFYFFMRISDSNSWGSTECCRRVATFTCCKKFNQCPWQKERQQKIKKRNRAKSKRAKLLKTLAKATPAAAPWNGSAFIATLLWQPPVLWHTLTYTVFVARWRLRCPSACGLVPHAAWGKLCERSEWKWQGLWA